MKNLNLERIVVYTLVSVLCIVTFINTINISKLHNVAYDTLNVFENTNVKTQNTLDSIQDAIIKRDIQIRKLSQKAKEITIKYDSIEPIKPDTNIDQVLQRLNQWLKK